MGISALHQALKNLCLKTDWNYAVFWKLNPRARMMLTCEDAYYHKNDSSGSNGLLDEHYAQDLLGIAVAKMSYLRYSLGEGVVGQVAVTDKHLWIFGDQLVNDPCFSFEDYDGWKTQFAAGIKTLVVVAVVPHGVVQIGSLKNIPEDLKLVNHIREIFFNLQTSFDFRINNNPYAISDLDDRNRDPFTSNPQMPTNSNETMQSQIEIDAMNMNEFKNSFTFPAGCELYEALGPAFYEQNNNVWKPANEVPSNLLTPGGSAGGPAPEHHLLEAVVANVSQTDGDFGSGSGSGGCYSFDKSPFVMKDDMMTSPETTYGSSSLGFSSASQSRGSESRSQETGGKKRARPGESGRPRPRDRQLIQDRIKELRELVPNGSKCSIDSLLERTIKHMMFMQSVTKHADKIDKYAELKLLGKETGVRGSSSHEQGSSWAMEVGNNLKVCPVTVENIGNNGQMLVEMMCEEGVDFLEIADAIRSLGLVILKGVTEPDGDNKSWMCFVVEGDNNRNVHRMDILWLLVQILQSKTKT